MTDDHCDDYEADHDWEHYDEHGYNCDCEDCEMERAMDKCGRLPPKLGGGCTKAGSEYCDFDCPFRDEVFSRRKKQ